ncbi:MAG: cardiolipin synthase B [Burkholderiales bacterium]|nr:MAG: cardiolipin synthase B [Burkholderiales bacterium]
MSAAASRRPAFARAAAAALLVATFAGCADVADRMPVRPAPEAAPTPSAPAGARGPLADQAARELVAGLRAQGHSERVARWLAATQTPDAAPLIVGNATRLLVDGPETYRAMFEAIAVGRRHVHLETYILAGDETGRRLADLLLERRRQGVRVSVLYDAIGAIGTPTEYFDRLRDGGVALCEFNPITPRSGRPVSLNHRDHRKILVVDGRIAYTGGVNISDVYSSGSASARRRSERGTGWRDTHIEIRGPAVAELQALFVGTWRRQGCPDLPDAAADSAPPPAVQGDRVLRVLASTPDDARNAIRDELLVAMGAAERSIHVTMAYFVPDPRMLETLEAAARRGVDVTLVLPGFSDFWAVLAAGRSHYARLLEAGVTIRERRDALLHAKTVVIDGVWATVGSANMDWRSFLHNDEVNIVVIGEGFGSEMERMFAADVERSVPVEAAAWSRRGLAERAKEGLARLLEYWL